jgi:hypothetical protein
VPIANQQLDDPDQLELINSTAQALVNVLQMSNGIRTQLDGLARAAMGKFSQSKAVAEYQRFYKEELELNEHFNNFARSLAASCEGANTILAQLGHAPAGRENEEYSERFLGEPDDEALPLSIGFQNIVRCFVDYHIVGRRL